jgi:ribosomal protein L37AE/L43A
VLFGRGVLAWHRILQRAAHSEPVDERRPGRCRRCERQALRRWQDEGHVKCENCGLIMNQQEYEELRDKQLREVEGVEARAS